MGIRISREPNNLWHERGEEGRLEEHFETIVKVSFSILWVVQRVIFWERLRKMLKMRYPTLAYDESR